MIFSSAATEPMRELAKATRDKRANNIICWGMSCAERERRREDLTTADTWFGIETLRLRTSLGFPVPSTLATTTPPSNSEPDERAKLAPVRHRSGFSISLIVSQGRPLAARLTGRVDESFARRLAGIG